MHQTTLPLGKYAADPRFRIVKVEGHDAIRTDTYTIIHAGTTFQLWHLDEPNAIYPHHTEKSLTRALGYAIGDPHKVGPTGTSDWLHTDGRIYKHDPATTGMRAAGTLRVGDVVDFPRVTPFQITGPAAPQPDSIGRSVMTYPVRRLNGGGGSFPYRDGDLVPVRFS